MEEHDTATSPSWNDIFREIGIQLHHRGGVLTKRVLWISAPVLIFFYIVRLALYNQTISSWLGNVGADMQLKILILGVFVVIVLAVATIILMAISKIEQIVWVDSYFDGKNLTTDESWRIAKRLYFAWVGLQKKLFYRYYMWVLFGLLATIVLGIYLFVISDLNRILPTNVSFTVMSLYIIISGIALVISVRYLKIKLSYAPFIFVDCYAGAMSSRIWKDFFSELNALSDASKGESFKKNLMIEIGADLAVTVVDYIASVMQSFTGRIVGLTGKEVGIRTIYFARLVSRYVLYRFAFKAVHGETHRVNEYVYDLRFLKR